MLASLISFVLKKKNREDPNVKRASYRKAEHYQATGDPRNAITAYLKHLEKYPLDVEAINNLACCYIDIGDDATAFSLFEKAYSIDDTHLPVIINHAKSLVDKGRINDALPYIKQAKSQDPDNPMVASVYSSIMFNLGDADTASKFALIAWLGAFDTLRLANSHLWKRAYIDEDELNLAAEHRFWAETLAPIPRPSTPHMSWNYDLNISNKKGRVRIGYLSPDFRNHSVRYFALPLLENHDRNSFEIFVYHDSHFHDDQTNCIKKNAEHFIDVNEIPDTDLIELITKDRLDILVDLAGHTSANRINIYSQKLAIKQITGLGYPPTTGLSSIDGKLLDAHIADKDSLRYYTEKPIVLNSSFWCFDPKETPDISAEPPAVKNGYITFACAGNIAKITPQMLGYWRRIMEGVKDCRLQIRSISFSDPSVVDVVTARLSELGFDLNRVEILGPTSGDDFFSTYNNVDIVLDTYPFNGGTTTCFATYMGVPVLSMAGDSLISRMGKSVLSNLGLYNWIASDYEEYVDKAILFANDLGFLAEFRKEARVLYASSGLGSGLIFARDFEQHCLELLEQQAPTCSHSVTALPAMEIVSRAYTVFRYGQFEAAGRIVDHCLKEYPNCGRAHVLWTQRLTEQGKFIEAANYLENRLAGFNSEDRFLALVNVARFNILASRHEHVKSATLRADECAPNNIADRNQLKLLQAYINCQERPTNLELNHRPPTLNRPIKLISVVIICDDTDRFNHIKNQLEHLAITATHYSITFHKCPEAWRRKYYIKHFNDNNAHITFLIQKNVDICNTNFFDDVISSLEKFDIVGIGGATRWDRLDWRHCEQRDKSSCFLIPSGEDNNFYEIMFTGDKSTLLVGDMAVLDGNFLAIRNEAINTEIISTLLDSSIEKAGLLLEEQFTYALGLTSVRLGAHLNLGIIIDWRIPLSIDNLGDARWELCQKRLIDPFVESTPDRKSISIPVPTPSSGVQVLSCFLK